MNYTYLAHHGIKGQKWGVRRYQNEDGSLTEEGRRHYGIGDNKYFTDNVKRTAALSAKESAKRTAKTNTAIGIASTAVGAALAPGMAPMIATAWLAGVALTTSVSAVSGATAGARGAHKQDREIAAAVSAGKKFSTEQLVYTRRITLLP